MNFLDIVSTVIKNSQFAVRSSWDNSRKIKLYSGNNKALSVIAVIEGAFLFLNNFGAIQ